MSATQVSFLNIASSYGIKESSPYVFVSIVHILIGYDSLKEVGLQETNPIGSGYSSSGNLIEYAMGLMRIP